MEHVDSEVWVHIALLGSVEAILRLPSYGMEWVSSQGGERNRLACGASKLVGQLARAKTLPSVKCGNGPFYAASKPNVEAEQQNRRKTLANAHCRRHEKKRKKTQNWEHGEEVEEQWELFNLPSFPALISSVSSQNTSPYPYIFTVDMHPNHIQPAPPNLSCFLYGPGDARYEEHPVPIISDPYDVLVRIHFVGVCGSDVHSWCHGRISKKFSIAKPLIMGHEASGVVHELGAAVSTLKVGDKVVIEPGYPCRRCAACKSGQYQLCPDMKFAACPPDVHGTLTRLFRLPSDFCYKLPDSIGLDEAVLVEPLAVAVHAAKVAKIVHGEAVVVLGSGTIGLLCGAAAKAFGAGKVVIVDILDKKLQFASGWGNLDTFIPDLNALPESNADRLINIHQLGLGADVVIEASGAASSVNLGIHTLRAGGSFVQVGMVGKAVVFDIQTVCEKELHVHGSFRYGAGDFDTALQMLNAKTVDFKSLITAVLPFEQATDAWEMTRQGQGIKNLIRGPGL